MSNFFLNKSPQARETKANMNKWDYIMLKSLLMRTAPLATVWQASGHFSSHTDTRRHSHCRCASSRHFETMKHSGRSGLPPMFCEHLNLSYS